MGDGNVGLKIIHLGCYDWMEEVNYPPVAKSTKKRKSRKYSGLHDIQTSWPHKTISGMGIIGMLKKNDRRKAVLRRRR